MRREMEMIRQFHDKNRFPVGINPGENHETDMVRLHLIQEELSEYTLGLGERSIIKMADALGDLAYVVLGAAVTYGIPLAEVFDEIQQSNMTKEPRRDGDTRLRNKGESYRRPDIDAAINRGMARTNRYGPLGRPVKVCLVGSTRFKEAFEQAEADLADEGKIVLTVSRFGHRDGLDMDSQRKRDIDELHLRKIDESDEVKVINPITAICMKCRTPCATQWDGVGFLSMCCQSTNVDTTHGYIGPSSVREVEYTRSQGKPVHWLTPEADTIKKAE